MSDPTGSPPFSAAISDRKKMLLEQRFGPSRNSTSPLGKEVVGFGIGIESEVGFNFKCELAGSVDEGIVYNNASESKYAVELVREPAAGVIIHAQSGGGNSSGALSNREDKEKLQQHPQQQTVSKRSVEVSAFDILRHAKTPKMPRIEESDGHGTNDGHSRGADRVSDGSRSSNEKGSGSSSAGSSGGSMKTILNYFSPQITTTIGTSSSATSTTATSSSLSVNTLQQTSSASDQAAAAAASDSDVILVGTSVASKSKIVKSSVFTEKSTVNASSTQNAVIVDLKKQLESLKAYKDQADHKILRAESEQKIFAENIRVLEERNQKLRNNLETVYRTMAQQEGRRKRELLAQNIVRLGKISTVRTGPATVQDIWEEGFGMKDFNKRNEELQERKEELEKRKKRLATLRRAAKKGAGDDDMDVEMDLDLAAEADAIRSHVEQLKRDENALAEERRLLESEKAAHHREFRRCQSEDRSRFFKDLPCLNNRYAALPFYSKYLLLSLLGRGGFSEVWKAYDLHELREVAVKVHQLHPSWTEERKHSYIKHVTREYTIHRDLQHPRVVGFYDVFEIDINSFATVLEYCRGIDLDEKLKRMKTIPEKDARTILLQIVSGLKYLNSPGPMTHPSSSSLANTTEDLAGNDHLHEDGNGSQGPTSSSGSAVSSSSAAAASTSSSSAATATGMNTPNTPRRKAIIHFDLKPGNILFDEMGDVKITDFGLSKIFDESNEGTTMELTSQGAGTYWYLPPECFATGNEAPRISSKVDIWSLGVIFYQMLYGKKPFGDGKSQESVKSEGIISIASQVHFSNDPKAPKVSEEARDLIRQCLTADQRYRPDVHALCNHPYLRRRPDEKSK